MKVALTDTTIMGESEPGSNGNEDLLHHPQNLTIRFSLVLCSGYAEGRILSLGGGESQHILSHMLRAKYFVDVTENAIQLQIRLKLYEK